jgi:hypothetical protein
MQLFFSKRFLTKIWMFLSKNGILHSAKQFHEVDFDSGGQEATFFSQAFFDKKMFLSKTGISRSAKRFRKVDLDSWGQDKTLFVQVFFYKKLCFCQKTAFREVLNNYAKWI